jgi:hypothetical protein
MSDAGSESEPEGSFATESDSEPEGSFGEESESEPEENEEAEEEAESSSAAVGLEPTVAIGTQIRSLKEGVIRAGVEMDSEKGDRKLAAGEVFEVLEEGRNSEGGIRLRMADGWVSMTAKSGKPLCVEESGKLTSSQASPPVACAV